MNAIYRISNALVGTAFAGIMGFAVYLHAPEFWQSLDACFASGACVVGLVLVLSVGFLTLEARKV